jgi:hypothetical protein
MSVTRTRVSWAAIDGGDEMRGQPVGGHGAVISYQDYRRD